MVVKKHNIFQAIPYQSELKVLAQYIRQLNEQPDFIPPTNELLENCKHLVDCLARATDDEHQLSELLASVEQFLVRNINTLHRTLRRELIATVLNRLYFVASNPNSNASSLTSIVLVVCAGLDSNGMLNAVREVINHENRRNSMRLRSSLSCFYRWICEWNSRAVLGNWLLAFIKVLEEKEHFDILVEVSLDKITNLFLVLTHPNAIHQSVSEVIFHVLASLRESKLTFDKIAPAVNHLLLVLASDNNQWSRQLLQNVVDVTKSMIDNLKKQSREAVFSDFRMKYAVLMANLGEHMATRSCRFLRLPPWHCQSSGTLVRLPTRKVGLINLGNTCYMNCVIQALFATKQFSYQVVMNMSEHPYWSKLGSVFTDMMHSAFTKINTAEFYSVVKIFIFRFHQQQDCTEFLGHLLSLLMSYELKSEETYNYSHPLIFPSRKTCTSVVVYESPTSSVVVNCPDEASPAPPSSPVASSSTSQAVVTGDKRRAPDDSVDQDNTEESPSKRLCLKITLDSVVEQTYYGVFLKHIHCSNCQAMSASREKFRELQLSIPEQRRGCRLSIQNLIDFYFASELLTGPNMYRCGCCATLSNAARVLFCDITPKYLIVVLKSFRYDQKVNTQRKLMVSVLPNETVFLQIQEPGIENEYSLYCCIIHEGYEATTGHYYTVAKDNNQWYKYNDEKVTMIEGEYLQNLGRTSTPYMLFYRRRDIEEMPNPTIEELPVKFQEQIMSRNKTMSDTATKYNRNRALTTRSMKDVNRFFPR